MMRHSSRGKIESVANHFKEPELKAFCYSLFDDVDHYNLSLFDTDYCIKSTEAAFSLMQNLKPGQFKVEFVTPQKNAESCFIQILNTDIPFLIDSLLNELKRRDVELLMLTHPMFNVKRDAKGRFLSFDASSEKESILQFHIPNNIDSDLKKDLIKMFEEILANVNFAVSDWKAITTKITTAADLICANDQHNTKQEEVALFLKWLVNNNFVFLGSLEYKVRDGKYSIIPGSKLGIAKSDFYKLTKNPSAFDAADSDLDLSICKSDERSLILRSVHMDNVIIKSKNEKGEVERILSFYGLFSSSVYRQSIRDIPLVRNKVNRVIKRYGYPENSYSCKELITALEQFPRAELLQIKEDELLSFAANIVSLGFVPKVRIFLRKGNTDEFVSCMIFIPEKKFSTEVRQMIESILCVKLKGSVSKRYVQIGESSITRLQVIIRSKNVNISDIDLPKIEAEITRSITGWDDELLNSILAKFTKPEALALFAKYHDAFDIKYRAVFAASKVLHDIKMSESCISLNSVQFDVYISKSGADAEDMQLKIYAPNQPLALSTTLPILENLGLFAQDMLTYPVSLRDDKMIYIHHFRLKNKFPDHFEKQDEARILMIDALNAIWQKQVDDDRFNTLVSVCGLNVYEVNLMRALCKYMKQTQYSASIDFTIDALIAYPAITKALIELFELKFSVEGNQFAKKVDSTLRDINHLISHVKTGDEDYVMRSILSLIIAIKRTNFFQKVHGQHKSYISFKIASEELEFLPKPKPYAEIFVYSTRFEAVHLRGGKVARGGLRWSDRKEDFRTEVLGLMKAQMTKNSVIVPVGSKGGFVVKTLTESRADFQKEGVECYKLFLSAMLDITDNIVNSKVVHPQDVIIHDESDPYLVVAADKGTATFSDHANAVSAQYKFWLGDAFASGGSVGYDHKKMAITAKGAWISVERHFSEMGVDIATDTFTAVGIGDMAGDVFGNGMLLSDNMKLLAAFNHMHIFLDPAPETKASFAERKRLFNTPGSSWSDYNSKLISKGGGVFERKAKSINISPEVAAILEIEESTLTPDQLIKKILKANVDLLWNGGIGTYVKSSMESNEKIGDKANDVLRVDGVELRCKMVGEGGNLGCTQLGRIEYAKNGGRINTDFIDNSAGVDCSDHEVNIKIAVSSDLLNGKLLLADRNKMLEKMTDEVAHLVLLDNYKQTQIISIETLSTTDKTSSHDWLIKRLEYIGELDRKLEFLPSAEDMKTLIAQGKRLTRPEVAVLLAYAKNSAYHSALKSDLSSERFLDSYLHSYFPKDFQKKSSALIEEHKLKSQILTTVLVNDLVNTLGPTFFHQASVDLVAEPDEVIKAYALVKALFGLDKLWDKIEQLPPSVPIELKISLFEDVQFLYKRNIAWILVHNKEWIANIGATVSRIHSSVSELMKNGHKVIGKERLKTLEAELEPFAGEKALHALAKEVINAKLMIVSFDIISIAEQKKKSLLDVASKYFEVGEKLSIAWLLNEAQSFVPRQYFQLVALRLLVNRMQHLYMVITIQELTKSKAHDPEALDNYNSFMEEVKSGNTVDAFISKLTIALQKICELYNLPL